MTIGTTSSSASMRRLLLSTSSRLRTRCSLVRRGAFSSTSTRAGLAVTPSIPSWSHSLSFASPESDFQAASTLMSSALLLHRDFATLQEHNNNKVWSHEITYTSPESDFTALSARSENAATEEQQQQDELWSGQFSFASPESDFTSQHVGLEEHSDDMDTGSYPIWSGLLSFASPESDFSSSQQVPQPVSDDNAAFSKLPKTLAEAMSNQNDAIVVTTASAPHSIVHVNHAWEELCGYHQDEVLHKTLSVIQGPRSNEALASSTVTKLLQTKRPVDMYQINYTKNGQDFVNHVTMGSMILNEDNRDVELLVGILQKVTQDQVPLRMIHTN